MTHQLLFTLAISVGIQAVFFAFAASFKTDRVTDLSYGLTFIVLAALLLVLFAIPAPLAKLRGKFRFHILLLGNDQGALHGALEAAGSRMQEVDEVQWIVDIDPVDML